MMKSKKYAMVKQEICVSCGTCVKVCPRKVIDVIKGCFAEVKEDECVGCGICAGVCPAGCISVVEREAEER